MNSRPESAPGVPPPEIRRLVASSSERFQEAWRAAGRPLLEPFLDGLSEAERAAVLRELVALEAELRSDRGEYPTLGEYLDRFPSDASVVTAALTSLRETSVADGPIQEASATPATERDEPEADAPTLAASTLTTVEGPPPFEGDRNEPVPQWLGRYRVVRLLGRGNFGRVYLARDGDLNRDVAIKVPTAQSLARPGRLEALLNEGRLAAGLKHPAIVRVFDIGRGDDGTVFIVLEYVDGTTLAELLGRGRLEPLRLAGLIAEAADAVHDAHRAGLVHRDLKPSNIILDRRGRPKVTDFGLALSEALQRDKAGEVAGTPSYMAPEQVRGEAHRLDGRTDIWALGVILYQGLTGRLPFPARDRSETFDEILRREPRPPRQIDDALPRELERICLKCLAKRMTDRFETAMDLAEELRAWSASASASAPSAPAAPAALRVVPKGLRSFDQGDTEFFLSLLPGPRGRDGLPESIRFWKARVEDRGDGAFRVGLLYGPSGGGKSSWVRAGLLPRLGAFVRPFYVECSRDRTEESLMAALRRQHPGLPDGCGLVEALAMLREGGLTPKGVKVLLVLDQFEQWLHAHPDKGQSDVVGALRQCDGHRVGALLLVRDDFWLAIARFFRAIEVPLREGENSNPVELFDREHARGVLAGFGRACGRLPDGAIAPGSEAARFIDEAVREMCAADGRVAPVRLSLFAEVVRHRPWNPSILRGLGGIEGIGMTFLAETFDAKSSPPSHRIQREAAQGVLQALLPSPTSILRGRLRSATELREASGLLERPGDFDELIRLLDSELRMITPVDRDGDGDAEASYQLAHDFLITPIRQWIERKQRSTRAGRARLRLASITGSWSQRPGSQRLASPLEWIGILWHTRPSSWSPDERRMMRAAIRHTLTRAAAAVVLGLGAALVIGEIRHRDRAGTLLRQALEVDAEGLPAVLDELRAHQDRVREDLKDLEADPNAPSRDRRIATLLLYRERPSARRAVAMLNWARDAEPDELALIRDAFAEHPSEAIVDRLRRVLRDGDAEPAVRLRFASVLARLEAVDSRAWRPFAGALADALLDEERRHVPRWLALLGDAVPMLEPHLGRTCGDASLDPSRRSDAAEAITEAAFDRGDSASIARVLVRAQPEATLILLRGLERIEPRGPALDVLRAVEAEPESEAEVRGRASAVIALAALGDPGPLRQALGRRPDPRLRSRAVQQIAALGLGSRVFPDSSTPPDADPGVRQAVLMAWSETPRGRLSPPVRAEVLAMARRRFLDDVDPGVHSAASLLLRRWGDSEPPLPAPEAPEGSNPDVRHWERGPNGHTLVLLPGPLEFRMGSPESEPERFAYETRHHRRIDRSLLVSTTEVTVAQFLGFRPDYTADSRYVRTPECPGGGISWYEALAYCNWLSERDGLDRSEWCYPDDCTAGMQLPDDLLERSGFRLPTEAEWEYFARAGTETARPFGETEESFGRHAWTWLTSQGRAAPAGSLLPNEFGLFDTLGSLWEWCHDGPIGPDYYPDYPEGTPDDPAPDPFLGLPVNDEDWRIIRGGAFDASPAMARSAHRDIFDAGSARYMLGFRVVRTVSGLDR